MKFIRNRAVILFFLAVLVTSGCRILPWWGDFPDADEETIVSEIILSRSLDASQALNFRAADFRLSIPAGALPNDVKIEITRYNLPTTKLNLPKEYRAASNIFSIDIQPEIDVLNQPATIEFTPDTSDSDKIWFVGRKDSSQVWKFASPIHRETGSAIVVETLSFSDWMLVENITSFAGSLDQGMWLTASPTAAVASNTGFFDEDVMLSIGLQGQQPISLSPTNSQLELTFFSQNSFNLSVANPESPTNTRNFSSDSERKVRVDLLSSGLGKIESNGYNATCSLLLKLTGKKPAELPDFFAMQAIYTSESGIEYNSVQTLTFSEATPAEITEQPPQISDTQPANGDNFVASSTEIMVIFDKKMNLEATQNAFRLTSRAGTQITGSFGWQEDRVMTFSPDQPLLPSTEYVFRFVDGAIGQNELALISDGEFSFTTASNDPAELVNFSPADGSEVDFNTPIVLEFSQAIDPEQIFFTITPSLPGDFTANWNEAGNEVSIIYGSGFASNQGYQVNVLETTKDIFGVAIKQAYTFSFNSKSYVANRLIEISPASGSSAIAPDSSFVFTFDQAMDKAAVIAALSFSPTLSDAVYTWSADSTQLTITHATRLQTGTDYLVTLLKTDANQLITSYPISYQVVESLQVTNTSPANDSSGQQTTTAIEITFNNPVKTDTLGVTFDPAPVNGFTQSWSDNNTTLLLTPTAPGLQESMTYQITILAATTDIYQNSLAQDQILNFSTGAFTPPIINSTIPTNDDIDVAVNSQIEIHFSKSMDRTQTQSALTIVPATTPSFTWQNNDSSMLIGFAEPLAAGTIYQINLSTNTADKTGLKLEQAYSFSFTTAAPATPDPTSLESYEPADSSTPVDTFAPVVLRFSQPINQSTLAFEISPTVTGDYTTTWNDAGTEASINFNSGYGSGISYTFSLLDTTQDIYGQSLSDSTPISFTSVTYAAARLLTVVPASGTSDLDPDSVFDLTFDRAMNTANVESAISISPITAANYQWFDGDTRLRITPAARLALATSYQLSLPNTAKAADNSELLTSYQISWKTAPQFQVSETIPINNTAGLPLRPSIEIRFNNSVDVSTLALSWLPAPAGYTTTWSENNTLLTLLPDADLLESENYRIVVGQNTKDIYGTTLASDYPLNFTTGAVTPPTVSSTQPAAGLFDVAVDEQIRIVFSKTMNKTLTQQAISIAPETTPAYSWENGDTTLLIDVGGNLGYDASYQITIGTGATDKYGLSLAQAYLLSFKTVARPAVVTTKCYPTANATGISPQAVIKIEFSKEMNKDSAQAAFSLKQNNSAVAGSFSWSGNIMSFTPSTDLAYAQTCETNIAAGALDTLGNSLAAAVTWSFTTAFDEGRSWNLEHADTTETGTFSQRSEHVMISFNEKLWIIGGFDGFNYLNDIWSSSDGSSWTQETAAAAFAARSGHACIVQGGKIWLTGGYSDSNGLFDDVWNSSDGKNWVRVNSSADYYARANHTMAAFANKIWVIAGESADNNGFATLLDDCWSSADGLTWQQHSSIVAFFPRKMHVSGVLNNRLWVWGGYGEDANANERALNDVWSTADGEFWRLESSSAAFPARCAAAGTVFNNRIWLMGGANNDPYDADATYYNDIWTTSDGVNWVQILGNSDGSSTQFTRRVLFAAAALADSLYISGGELSTYYLNNEVWSTR